MTTLDFIELFASEMINEITHSAADETLQDSLFKAVADVKALVIETYETRKTK